MMMMMKPLEKLLFGRSRWDDNIKMNLREIDFKDGK
jgi:hypothetical protein